MILADLLSISIKLLLVLHVVVSLLLILVVLMQRPKQEGLGAAFGGGMADQVWGAQTTNVLQKGTVYLGTLFMVLSLVLAILIGNANHEEAINKVAVPPVEEAPAVPTDIPEGGSILDELNNAEEGAPLGGQIEMPAPDEGEDPAPEAEAPETEPEAEETPEATESEATEPEVSEPEATEEVEGDEATEDNP